MNKPVNLMILSIATFLVCANIFVFVRGIYLAEEIRYHEREINSLRVENTQLTQTLYQMNSHTISASHAAVLGYGSFNDPVYFETAQYARNQ